MSLLVSVVVPVYNAENVLTDTMGNLIYQSIFERYGEGSCEILLVDDCSTDSTPYILDDLQRQFPNRIRVFHLPENLGPGGARNVGMDEARGQFVGFVNCDDMVDVVLYERLYECATENGYFYDVVDSPLYNESTGKTRLATSPELVGAIDANVKCNLLMSVGHIYTHLISRELLEHTKIRTREHVSSEDEDFLAEVLCRARSLNVYGKPLYVHREGGKSHAPAMSETDSLVKPFSRLVSCCLSAYGRLTAIEDYEDFKPGAEAFYLKRFSRALYLHDTFRNEGTVPKELTDQLLETVRRACETIVTIPLTENPYAEASIAEKGKVRLEKYLGV